MDVLCSNLTLNGTYDPISGPPCVTQDLTTAGGRGYGGGGGSGGGSGRPGGGGGYSGRFGPTTCGYCTTTCVYKSIEITFILGILANLIVIFRVIFDKKLRDPTFTAIAALAIADLVFLSTNIAASFETVINTINCWFPPKIYASRPYYIILSISWFAASGHVALLAILRYVTLAFPLRANILLTCKRVMLLSLFVWILGSIFMGSLTMLIVYKVVEAGTSQEFQIYLWFFVYLVPLILTITLHFAKIVMVKKAVRNTATDATRKAVERMSKIVLTVIICAAILPFPRLMYKILNINGVFVFPSREFQTHFKSVAQLFYLLNNFINPFLYGFMSSKFRDSVKEMFNCYFLGQQDDSVATSDTPLSRRKEMINLNDVEASSKRSESLGSLQTFRK